MTETVPMFDAPTVTNRGSTFSAAESAIRGYLTGLEGPRLIEAVNMLRGVIANYSPFKDEPTDYVMWVPADDVHANEYNPNVVAPVEMELLRLSIAADGYTQPIVTMRNDDGHRTVIDGFHRNRVGKECADVRQRVHGYLPVVQIRATREGASDRMASTIRHNRARGKHQVQAMSDIVIELRKRNWTPEKIARELGMEADEVLRLCQISGLAEMFTDEEFSASWDAIGADESASDFGGLEENIADFDTDAIASRGSADGDATEAGEEDDGKLKRVFHTYDKWECYPAGFYETTPPEGSGMNAEDCKEAYATFLRDIPRFEAAMERVLAEWPNSTEHYLSNDRMNRIAWLGQAAMCIDTGIPSTYCNGYARLSPDEQNAADTAALHYLNRWLEARGHDPLPDLNAAARRTQPELY